MGEEVDYDALIHGTTLKVYKYLLSHPNPVGVRDLQRSLDFSSPSVASHHLNKLEEWGICSKSVDSKYTLEKKVNIGVMKHFILFRGSYIPRFAFYTAFFVSILLTYLIYCFFIPSGQFDRIIGISVLTTVAFIIGYETWRLQNMLNKGL